MDIMETFTVNVTGGGMEPACRCNCDLFVYHRYCCEYWLCSGSVSGCYLPARPSKPACPSKTDFRESHHLVFGDTRWCVFVAAIYWVMHHSRLNQSVAAPSPES